MLNMSHTMYANRGRGRDRIVWVRRLSFGPLFLCPVKVSRNTVRHISCKRTQFLASILQTEALCFLAPVQLIRVFHSRVRTTSARIFVRALRIVHMLTPPHIRRNYTLSQGLMTASWRETWSKHSRSCVFLHCLTCTRCSIRDDGKSGGFVNESHQASLARSQ